MSDCEHILGIADMANGQYLVFKTEQDMTECIEHEESGITKFRYCPLCGEKLDPVPRRET